MGGQVYGSDGVAPTLTGDEGIKIALPTNDGISIAGMLPEILNKAIGFMK